MTNKDQLNLEISSSLFTIIELNNALEALDKADVVGAGFSLVYRNLHAEIDVTGEKIARKYLNENDCEGKMIDFPQAFFEKELKERLHNILTFPENMVEELKTAVNDGIIDHNASVKFQENRKKMPF